MIQRNLGNLERLLRLLLAVSLLVWTWRQQAMDPAAWCVLLVSIALMLNGIFSRCYLWYVLEIDTSRGRGRNCRPESNCA